MVSSTLAILHGMGLATERVRGLARRLGLAHGRDAGAADPGSGAAVALMADGAETDDPRLWQPPFAAWIDAGNLDDGALAGLVAQAMRDDLFACLTTATANRLHLAGRLVAALAARRPLSDVQRDDIELALHEAISNAVVHGNLQVEGMKGLSATALERFSQDLTRRMADPAFTGRRVEVGVRLEPGGVVVEVADEGSGYEPLPGEPSGTASGRGLGLILAIAQSCELLDHGRRIRMRFAL